MGDDGNGNGSEQTPNKPPPKAPAPPKEKPKAPDNVEFREGEQPKRPPKTEPSKKDS